MARGILLATLLSGLTLAGCVVPHGATRPAALLHIVYFDLHDAQDAAALRADCDALLATIPSVVIYAAGQHFEFDRDNVDSDYDLALLVGFENGDGYRAYLDHVNHVGLVERWRPRIAALRIHDVRDRTP